MVFINLWQDQIRVAADCGDDVVEVVGDASRQTSQAAKVGLAQLHQDSVRSAWIAGSLELVRFDDGVEIERSHIEPCRDDLAG